jgi:hypothetical protein
MSLKCEVNEVDVSDDEIEMRRSSMSWDCWRASNIWLTKSNDWISDENFSERYNLRLTYSKFVVFLKNSRKCRKAKLDDKFVVFSNWIIVFRKSSRSMTQFCDQIDSSTNFSNRVLTAFEIRENVVRLIMFEMKNLMFVETRSKNLCLVRKKSLNWKQSWMWFSERNFFIKELKNDKFQSRFDQKIILDEDLKTSERVKDLMTESLKKSRLNQKRLSRERTRLISLTLWMWCERREWDEEKKKKWWRRIERTK